MLCCYADAEEGRPGTHDCVPPLLKINNTQQISSILLSKEKEVPAHRQLLAGSCEPLSPVPNPNNPNLSPIGDRFGLFVENLRSMKPKEGCPKGGRVVLRKLRPDFQCHRSVVVLNAIYRGPSFVLAKVIFLYRCHRSLQI